MRKAKTIIACMAALAFLFAVQSAPAQGKLEGVWRVSEVTFTGANAGKITVTAEHPNLIIFTKKHFSFLNIMTTTDTRPDLPANATDAQKVAAWTPVAAWAGTYGVKGNIVTFRNIVHKDPGGMVAGNFGTSEFKIEGNTLIETPKTDQNGTVVDPIITKFVRVE